MPLVEWKKFQKHFSQLSAKDNVELLREDNLRKNGVQPESSLNSRSVPRRERDSVAEEPPTKAGDNIESGPEKLDRLTISNVKQKSKKEQQVFLKTEDRIKMAYTAYTFHDTSAFETSVVDLKSVSSELPGVSSDKTSTSISELEQLQKNIENSRLYIGDASPIRQVEQFQPNVQNSTLTTLDSSTQRKIIHNELQDNEKEIGSNSEVDSGKESTDGSEKEIKTGQNFFSIGKQFVNRLIKWGISGYEMTSYNYELTSSKNRLHTLSKNLTK